MIMPVCSEVKLLPISAVDNPMHFCTRPLATGNSKQLFHACLKHYSQNYYPLVLWMIWVAFPTKIMICSPKT